MSKIIQSGGVKTSISGIILLIFQTKEQVDGFLAMLGKLALEF